MNILVTGGAGFIGSNLCFKLVNEGHKVYCIDNFYSCKKENILYLKKYSNFKFIEHDIIFPLPKKVSETIFDQIYHLACPASPVIYQKDHIYTLKVNFEGTLNILNFAKKQFEKFNVKPKFLFTSTSEVYGDPEVNPQTEDYRGNVNPHGIRSCYDEGKRAAESLCMNFWRKYNLPVKIVRIFNTYGPKMDPQDGRAVSNFIIQALKGKNLTIYGKGNQTRSFQYIGDLIKGMNLYMGLEENYSGPVNLGNPEEISIIDLAKIIIELTNTNVGLDFYDLPKDDPTKRCPDILLAYNKLGWKPEVNIKNGLKKTIEYFRSIV
ncbi:NAD-dependent epimerase/dehydratase family protein [Candidatus Peregrinibacteria bacterium]|nr:NAD-dependent epimerase/dehydratase family protein [Candidatus Peregrinibacteria bacterium]